MVRISISKISFLKRINSARADKTKDFWKMETNSITDRKISNNALSIFFALVITLSALCEWIYCNGVQMIVVLLMWIPALSAFVATRISINDHDEVFSYKRQHEILSIRKCRSKFVIIGILIPFFYLIVPYVIYWMTHPESINFGDQSVIYLII